MATERSASRRLRGLANVLLLLASCRTVATPVAEEDLDAFRRLARGAGTEYLAARIARTDPAEFLTILAEVSREMPTHRAKLLEGDLNLALLRRDEALACYREAAAGFGAPGDEYAVESPSSSGEPPVHEREERPLPPFSLGPGSHRDNWLLRRFLALEAWNDAAAEFRRIWEIHRANACPRVVIEADRRAPGQSEEERWTLVTPAGFDGKGLQFSLDYTYFLKRRGDLLGARAVLMEPVFELDMDRNPDLPRREPLPPGASPFPLRVEPAFRSPMSAGISRREFLRIAHGELKLEGRADELARVLERLIAAGENRARRVLARVRLLEGRPADALVLELAYVEHGKLDPLSAAVRIGMAYDEAGKLAEAAAEYEKALSLPYVAPLALPAITEEEQETELLSSKPRRLTFGDSPIETRLELLARLDRLYGALDDPERALEVQLRRFDAHDAACEELAPLERARDRFRAAGQEPRLLDWARQKAAATASLPAKANLCWLVGDRAGSIRALAALAKRVWPENRWGYDRWKKSFRKTSQADYLALLEALVEANPGDAQTRLELLDAKGITDGAELVCVLEQLLESPQLPLFSDEDRNRTPLRSRWDLAYRLMRQYERTPGGEPRLVALGFRILESEGLFARSIAVLRRESLYHGEDPADVRNSIALLLAHLVTREDVERAAGLIEKTGSVPLRRQVALLLPDRTPPPVEKGRGREAKAASVRIRTLGVPEGVRVLAERDQVTAIAPGARWEEPGGESLVWIGTPWGLVRYRRAAGSQQLEILQVPLGLGVTAFAAAPSGLYVGTDDGLFRVDDPAGAAPRITQVLYERADRILGKLGHPVEALLSWRGGVWIASRGGVYRYDPRRKEARYHANAGPSLISGRDRLWTSHAVYDPVAEEFQRIPFDDPEAQLVGAGGGEIWAKALVSGMRGRPAILDVATLELRPLAIADRPRKGEAGPSELELLGEHDQRVWLAGRQEELFFWDAGAGVLRRHRGARPQGSWTSVRAIRWALSASGLDLGIPPWEAAAPLCAVSLSHGRFLVGRRAETSARGEAHTVGDLETGLFVVDPAAGAWSRIDDVRDTLLGSRIGKVIRDGNRAYVCTDRGVTILAMPHGHVAGRITVSDGLPSNNVHDVVRAGERLYIACELPDRTGNLAVRDIRTGLIQVLTAADGLPRLGIEQLRVDGRTLHLLHGRTRSSIFDTASGKLADGSKGGPPEKARSQAPPTPQLMPVIGGAMLARGRDLLAGTRGLLLLSRATSDAALAEPWPREEVVIGRSRREMRILDAEERTLPNLSEMNRAFADPNPYYRARAIQFLSSPVGLAARYVPALLPLLDDPEVQVRGTALYVLSQLTDQEGLREAVARRLADPDRRIRALAVVMACRQGRVPDASLLREILTRHGWGEIPFGPSGSVTWHDHTELYAAVAPHADARVFSILLEKPPDLYPPRDEEPENAALLDALGKSVVQHPDAAATLLQARGASQLRFATAVFRHAGRRMLPLLHEALGSPDRVVRSNAARACGAIRDPGSIQPLLRALDLESGLARASIVDALARLEAREALPQLASLWGEVQSDEKRRRGAGNRASQRGAELRSQYDSLSNLDALGAEWNELKQAALPEPVDPRGTEELLSPGLLLRAVKAIGPALSQDFYRTLAGQNDSVGRREAAARLSECVPEEVERNAVMLGNLLADADGSVRIAATVSLLLLGRDDIARPRLLKQLGAGDRWEKRVTVDQLGRVGDLSRLAFARDALRAIAADPATDEETRTRASALAK